MHVCVNWRMPIAVQVKHVECHLCVCVCICSVRARSVCFARGACTLTRVDGKESMVMKKMYSENDISPSPLRSTCDHTYHEKTINNAMT
jgi:hypothetical protein